MTMDLETCSYNMNDDSTTVMEETNTSQIHEKIMQIVCIVCNVKKKEISSRTRTRNLVNARVLFSHLVNKYTSYTKTRIGRMINRDHASVLHYLKNHPIFVECDFEYKLLHTQCEALIRDKANLYDFSNQITYIESLHQEIEYLKGKYLEYKDKYSMLNYKYEKLCKIINN